MSDAMPAAATRFPTYREALAVWFRIGCLSFGGPAAQIALMHREVVGDRAWVSERRFLHALNFCMLLPGPEAQQLAIYLGWLLHGVKGGFAAGLLFVLPGAAVMLVLSAIYAVAGGVPVIAALFFGLKCAVLVVVVEALLRVARRALKGGAAYALAAAAFLALYAFDVPFPFVVLAAAVVGFLAPAQFSAGLHGERQGDRPALLDAMLAEDPGRIARLSASARWAGLASLAAWLVPLGLLVAADAGVWADIAWFFSKMALVTFGGAYAVLAYVAQEAVDRYGWLSAADMLAGLGLAETTPGPLILVLQFVGFLAALPHGGLIAGTAGAALTLLVTFAPCFAWIFLGAPFVERLHGQRALAGALAAVTAAVVGVIANLALWFGLRVLFSTVRRVTLGPVALDLPDPRSLDPSALALALLAALLLFPLKQGILRTLGVTALAGLALRLVL
ncbi:chromate efflux transporter [Elioraea rosea]|uniref:chromate efflux transporter n=1 Tax=Elioraea rosea TaxID=2492390 RepID=UPI0011827587|nr:chromate efflux transporter [Elioraea rosea]